MDFISIYSHKTSNGKIDEVAAIRLAGDKPLSKSSVVSAFTTMVERLESSITSLGNSVLKSSEKYFIVTHNLEQQKIPELTKLFEGRAWVDIYQLAWPLVVAGIVSSRTIENLSQHFSVTLENNPDCAALCTANAQIYGHMMRRYKTALTGEAVVRDIGGDTLEGIRKMVGF